MRQDGENVVNALEAWRRAHKLTYAVLARRLGTHIETARRYCLPATHKRSRIPDRRMMPRVIALTAGIVQPNDFYDLAPANAYAGEGHMGAMGDGR